MLMLKNTKPSSKNIQQAIRRFHKNGSLSKQPNDPHKSSQTKDQLPPKSSIHRASFFEKDNAKKKITCKKHANLRTFNFQDIVSNKVYTETSSLCASLQKPKHRNSTVNTVSKQRLKMSTQFSSYHQLSSNQLFNNSISMFCGQSDKKTIKLKRGSSRKDMEKILQRTKSVLDGWMEQKQKWFAEKKQYESKIKNMTVQLDILKEKIKLSDKDVQVKRTLVIK